MNSQSEFVRPKAMNLFGVPIHRISSEEAVRWVNSAVETTKDIPIHVSGVNAHFLSIASRERRFHEILAANDLNLADGSSVRVAARILGSGLPQRIPGIDFMVDLCRLAAATGRTVYFLGGMEGAAENAAKNLASAIHGLKIKSDRPPFGREFDPVVVAQIKQRIRDAHPDFLFVGMGVPQQEYWLNEYANDLPVKLVMGNGAAFDVLAGFFRRPPHWIQAIGMEWFARLCAEPRRLWHRYTLGNLRFLKLVFQQLLQEKMHPFTPAHL